MANRIIKTNHDNYRMVEENGQFEPQMNYRGYWIPLNLNGYVLQPELIRKGEFTKRNFVDLLQANRAIIKAMKLNKVNMQEVKERTVLMRKGTLNA